MEETIKEETKSSHEKDEFIYNTNCIFCKRVSYNKGLLHEEEDCVAFYDRMGAAEVHILVASREHRKDISCLTYKDIPLVRSMHKVGLDLLLSLYPMKTYKFGFHLPEFTSVMHLHLHALILPFKTKYFGNIHFGIKRLKSPQQIIRSLQNERHLDKGDIENMGEKVESPEEEKPMKEDVEYADLGSLLPLHLLSKINHK